MSPQRFVSDILPFNRHKKCCVYSTGQKIIWYPFNRFLTGRIGDRCNNGYARHTRLFHKILVWKKSCNNCYYNTLRHFRRGDMQLFLQLLCNRLQLHYPLPGYQEAPFLTPLQWIMPAFCNSRSNTCIWLREWPVRICRNSPILVPLLAFSRICLSNNCLFVSRSRPFLRVYTPFSPLIA